MARSALTSTAALTLQQVVGGVLGYVALFLILRRMPEGAEAWGLAGFGLAFAGFFVFITTLFDGAHLRFASGEEDRRPWNATFAVLKLGSLLAYVVIGEIGILGWGLLTDLANGGSGHLLVLHLFILHFVLHGIAEMASTVLRAEDRFELGTVPIHVGNVVKAGAMAWAALTNADPITVSIAFVLGSAAEALVAVPLVLPRCWGRPRWDLVPQYRTFGAPTFLGSAAGALLGNMDRVLIQFFWNAQRVGYYFAGARLLEVLSGLTLAMRQVLARQVFAAHGRGEPIEPLLGQGLRLGLLLVLPAVTFLVALPEATVHVFLSDSVLPGADALRLLALVVPLALGSAALGIGLQAHLALWSGLAVGLSSLVVNGVLNLALIPTSLLGVPLFGLAQTGAAIATVGAELWRFLGYLFLVPRRGVSLKELGMGPAGAQLVLATAIGLLLWGLTPAGVAWARVEVLLGLAALTQVAHVALGWRLGLRDADRAWVRWSVGRVLGRS